MVLPKLVISTLAQHRVRTALTVAAIALAVSLVVSVTTGYQSVLAFADRFLEQYLGSTDAQIVRGDPESSVPEGLVAQVAADPAVQRVTARLELRSIVLGPDGKAAPGPPMHVVGIRRPDDRSVDSLKLEAGRWFEGATGAVAVIDRGVANRFNVWVEGETSPTTQQADTVGNELILPRPGKQLRLRVIGVVHKPAFLAGHVMQTIYVPLETLQELLPAEEQHQVGRILIELKKGADAEAFAQTWRAKLKDVPGNPKLTLSTEARARMYDNLRGLYILSYLGGAISLLAATFIIFSALSMGVTERSRTLAMLRAIGAYRGQLARLVILEGLLLAISGVLVGVPLGWLWIKILSSIPRFREFFPAGVVVDWFGVLFGTTAALLAALAASALPAWTATRTDPLEAMAAATTPPRRRVSFLCAAVGVLLIAIDPFLTSGGLPWLLGHVGVTDPQEWARRIVLFAHFGLGLPGIMVGFFLLAPLFIVGLEAVLGPAVAAMLGIRFALLRQQLSGGVWRAAGTAAALMVGLSVLVAMQTQGNTLINGWKLPDKFPDIFIVDINPFGGLTPDDVRKVESVPGIKQGEVMAIAVASPQLGSSLASVAMLGVVPDATMFFGVDPDVGFKMMELDFREGTPEQAWQLLKQGRHLLVTNEFKRLRNIGVGDKFPLQTKNGTVDYTVAGVVWSPGLDVVKGVYDVGGQFDQRTAFSVFGTVEDARRDFGVDKVFLVAANLDPATNANHAVGREDLLKSLRDKLGSWGLRAGDVREIKHHIVQGFRNVLLLASSVAFAALAVASLGVTNTIMASIRTRRWQFGVLRSIGVTRSQLLRLVLGEAVLLGLVGAALGLAAGLEMSVNARRLSVIVLGYDPPLDVPWPMVLLGAGIVMVIAILASLWPAAHVARREPLELLQAGRAAT